MKELRDALDAIEPTTRKALELAYFGGLDIHAIAEILGRPVQELRPALRESLLAISAATRTGGSPSHVEHGRIEERMRQAH